MSVELGRPSAGEHAAVTGLGDPVLDIVSNVSYELLQSLHAEAGGCVTVQPEVMESLLAISEVLQGSLRYANGQISS